MNSPRPRTPEQEGRKDADRRIRVAAWPRANQACQRSRSMRARRRAEKNPAHGRVLTVLEYKKPDTEETSVEGGEPVVRGSRLPSLAKRAGACHACFANEPAGAGPSAACAA